MNSDARCGYPIGPFQSGRLDARWGSRIFHRGTVSRRTIRRKKDKIT